MGSTAVPSIAAAASSGVVFKGRPPAEKANGFNTFEWPALGSALFGISRLQDQSARGISWAGAPPRDQNCATGPMLTICPQRPDTGSPALGEAAEPDHGRGRRWIFGAATFVGMRRAGPMLWCFT